MLNQVKRLKNYKLKSLDGEIGKVKEFYFDDRHWTIRYLVVETGSWLSDRKVLISPYARLAVNWEDEHIEVGLTKKQIEDSPSWQSDKPVSRQFESAYYGYYNLPMYWNGPYMWGYSPYPIHNDEQQKKVTKEEKAWDHNLRSTDAVHGYHIQATDGEIGHVEDFIIDDETWAIRYLVVDTKNWWPGKKVIISPEWIQRVSWNESKILVNLYRDSIQQSPEYREAPQLTRDYELGIHRHYSREGYWDKEAATNDNR